MDIEPKFEMTCFERLSAGDLFIFSDQNGPCTGIAVDDPTSSAKSAVLLGPSFPPEVAHPPLLGIRSGTTVLSFGKGYAVRLPCRPNGWLSTEPGPDKQCLVVTEYGLYMRAYFLLYHVRKFCPCYVGIQDGVVVTTGKSVGNEYTLPRGTALYAVQWELLTTERKPRAILSYPFESA